MSEMLITAKTQQKKQGDNIKLELTTLTTQLLQKWSDRTTHLKTILNGFEFNYEELTVYETVQSNCYRTERFYWKANYLKPLIT